jgi:hypothetical protein
MANKQSAKERVRALKRLVFASTTFQSVELMCDHVETLGEKTSTLLHVPLLGGICVTYMNPFMSSGGLGPLPRLFTNFGANKRHARVHEDLKKLRNWFYAHRDTLNIPTLFADSASEDPFDRLTFHLDHDGTYSFSTHQLSWDIEGVCRVRDLCRFQRNRADRLADKILHQLFSTVPLAPGAYVLEDEFARLMDTD